jgi:hypothetical protein
MSLELLPDTPRFDLKSEHIQVHDEIFESINTSFNTILEENDLEEAVKTSQDIKTEYTEKPYGPFITMTPVENKNSEYSVRISKSSKFMEFLYDGKNMSIKEFLAHNFDKGNINYVSDWLPNTVQKGLTYMREKGNLKWIKEKRKPKSKPLN